MEMKSVPPVHWTDDQLIEYIYGVGPEDGHLDACGECRARVAKMEARRAALNQATGDEVSHDFLAAQRRSIYARITEPAGWRKRLHFRRWASALASGCLLGAGLMYYENVHQQNALRDRISDAQLAEDVSSMAQDREPSPTAPLQALFEE